MECERCENSFSFPARWCLVGAHTMLRSCLQRRFFFPFSCHPCASPSPHTLLYFGVVIIDLCTSCSSAKKKLFTHIQQPPPTHPTVRLCSSGEVFTLARRCFSKKERAKRNQQNRKLLIRIAVLQELSFRLDVLLRFGRARSFCDCRVRALFPSFLPFSPLGPDIIDFFPFNSSFGVFRK